MKVGKYYCLPKYRAKEGFWVYIYETPDSWVMRPVEEKDSDYWFETPKNSAMYNWTIKGFMRDCRQILEEGWDP